MPVHRKILHFIRISESGYYDNESANRLQAKEAVERINKQTMTSILQLLWASSVLYYAIATCTDTRDKLIYCKHGIRSWEHFW